MYITHKTMPKSLMSLRLPLTKCGSIYPSFCVRLRAVRYIMPHTRPTQEPFNVPWLYGGSGRAILCTHHRHLLRRESSKRTARKSHWAYARLKRERGRYQRTNGTKEHCGNLGTTKLIRTSPFQFGQVESRPRPSKQKPVVLSSEPKYLNAYASGRLGSTVSVQLGVVHTVLLKLKKSTQAGQEKDIIIFRRAINKVVYY